MDNPSCLNEIPIRKIQNPDAINNSAYVRLSDVQRLVCRRIIFLQLPNVEEDELTIRDYKYLFNIPDEMIEEERKRL